MYEVDEDLKEGRIDRNNPTRTYGKLFSKKEIILIWLKIKRVEKKDKHLFILPWHRLDKFWIIRVNRSLQVDHVCLVFILFLTDLYAILWLNMIYPKYEICFQVSSIALYYSQHFYDVYCCSMYKSTSGVVDSIGSPRCEMMVTRYDKKTNTKQEWRHSLHAIFVIRG